MLAGRKLEDLSESPAAFDTSQVFDLERDLEQNWWPGMSKGKGENLNFSPWI